MIRKRSRIRSARRTGKILVLLALLVPSLLIIVSLVVEGGVTMAIQGELRTLSDSAARVVAMKLEDGADSAVATQAGAEFVTDHCRLPEAPEISIEMPPTSGPYLGNPRFAEIIVTARIPFSVGSLWRSEADRSIRVRSVSGLEPLSRGARIITLNANATPGLMISGSGQVRVSGGVMVNSQGHGLNAKGGEVDGLPGYGAQVGSNAGLWADDVQVVGGVNNPSAFLPLQVGDRPPLRTQCPSIEDPLAALPLPTTSKGASAVRRGACRVTAGSAQLEGGNVMDGAWAVLKPGVYDYIEITGGYVRFESGIYILTAGKTNALSITGGTIDGTAGVMFYNTGADYQPATGLPDALGNATSKVGGILINAGADLHPLPASFGDLGGMLIYQRRNSAEAIEVQGSGTAGAYRGMIYAASALVRISGKGVLNQQFVVGQFSKTGAGDLSIDCTTEAPATAQKAFLVE